MKLYTHKDVVNMLNCFHTYEMNVQLSLLKLTPIELPSDEEIEFAKENAWSTYEYEEGNLYSTTFNGGFELGAKWMRDKIQGGNK